MEVHNIVQEAANKTIPKKKKSKKVPEKHLFCFIDYAKAFDCVDHKKL